MDSPATSSSRRRDAFSDLVRDHRAVMCVLARRVVGSTEFEDVVEAALTSAWRLFRGGESPTNPRAWLLRFVANECCNTTRSTARKTSPIPFLDDEHGGATEDIVSILQREMAHASLRDPRVLLDYVDEGLAHAVQGLSQDERVTLMLRAVGEFSYKDISETLDIPIGTVMSRLCRARERVRTALASNSATPASDGPDRSPADPPRDPRTRRDVR